MMPCGLWSRETASGPGILENTMGRRATKMEKWVLWKVGFKLWIEVWWFKQAFQWGIATIILLNIWIYAWNISPHKEFSTKSSGSELEHKPVLLKSGDMYSPEEWLLCERNFPKMVVVKTVSSHSKTHRFESVLKTKQNTAQNFK